MTEYIFQVEVLEQGQRKKHGDSYYSYKITSNRPQQEVKRFCTGVLKKSYERKDMPSPFAGLLIEFKKITDNQEGVGHNLDIAETYSYKVKTLYTG